MSAPQTSRTVPEVLHDILGNIEEIIRAEFRLVKAEIREEGARIARPGAILAAGIAMSVYAGGFLLLAAVYGLSTWMDAWLAALIVGGALAVLAVALVTSSVNRLKHLKPAPEKTIRSLEENVQWAKHRIK